MKISIIDFFKDSTDLKKVYSESEAKNEFAKLRPQLFIACFIAYFTFYLCKKNISVALPALSSEFNYSNFELGLIGSALYLTYGIGKFVNGVLVNKCNVQRLLPTALILTALINILIVVLSYVTSNVFAYLLIFIFLWGLNGWFQSIAFPSIIKIITYWSSAKERGTAISLWSTSHLLGIFVSAVLSGYLIIKFGWRFVFIVPALISIFVAFYLYKSLRDKPESIGLPQINDDNSNNLNEESRKKFSTLEILKKDILFNKTLWLFAISYIFVYMIRLGTEDWLVKYFCEVKHNSIDYAAQKLCILPLLGIVGSVIAGIASDKLFKGKRLPINLIFLFIVILSLISLKFNNVEWLDFVIISFLGIGIYGVQIMIGSLCAIECTSKEMSAAATGFTGLFGYVGAFLSSICTGFVTDRCGWNGTILFWIISAIICFILCLLTHYINKHCK